MTFLRIDLPLALELQRRGIPETAVGSLLMVLAAPGGYGHLRIQKRQKDLLIAALLTEPAVETLPLSILLRLALLDGSGPGPLLLEPHSQRLLHEIPPVVTLEIRARHVPETASQVRS